MDNIESALLEISAAIGRNTQAIADLATALGEIETDISDETLAQVRANLGGGGDPD